MDARTKCLASKQKLRRYEEANSSGYVRCISCGKILRVCEAEGGHYIPRTNRAVELEDDNIWPQCTECNQYRNGNVDMYRERLIGIIGWERVRRLELMASAWKGSDEAYENLSVDDKQSVSIRKRNSDYITLKRRFDSQARKIRQEKGI